MSKAKGTKNHYTPAAMRLAWESLTDEQREEFIAQAKAAYQKTMVTAAARKHLTTEELERLAREVRP